MTVKVLDGVILGLDNKMLYSVITDSEKSYQMNCDFNLLGLNEDDLKMERKFKMLIDENDDVTFEFLDEYANEGLTIEDLKKLKGIE